MGRPGFAARLPRDEARATLYDQAARREVLGRLLKLNHERYAEEVAQGLHEKGAKAHKKGKRVAEEKAQYAVSEQGELGWE